MSNSFVEADIKTYVAAKIKAEAKFQRWPSGLRADVETTLSTGAKGMFRWAVCQLDILRRLNHQSKIREAIKSLPKTMDETYERIFSYITDQEKEFVRHTLHWVCFHDFLCKGSVPLPANLLIDAYTAIDKTKSRFGSDEYLYDLEALKDSCGCLVSFTLNKEDQSLLANIAHYTVREFLESGRSSYTSCFTIKRKASYGLILDFVLDYAITSDPIEISKDPDHGCPLNLASSSNLQGYCLATAFRSLRDLEELIEPRLAFRFVEFLLGHLEALQNAFSEFDHEFPADISLSAYEFTRSWIDWHESTKLSKTTILAALLLMKCFSLAKVFLQDLDVQSVLQETLLGSIDISLLRGSQLKLSKFECNLVELLAEIGELDEDTLNFFHQEAYGLVCYTNFLPIYMTGHALETVCESSCVLPRLLQLGANPDPKGFQVTPLQIAVFSRDLAGVRTLLEAGADSNNIGDEQGIKWYAETSILRPYCCLHGLTPLYILRHVEAHLPYKDMMTIEEVNYLNGNVATDIEHLLLDYNASAVSMENRE